MFGGTKNPDVNAIIALRPDLVVMDKEENRAEDAEALEAGGLELLVTQVRSLADLPKAMSDLAAAAGRADPTTSDDWIEAPASPGRPPAGPHPAGQTVWVPIWRRPWMSISRLHLRARRSLPRSGSATCTPTPISPTRL